MDEQTVTPIPIEIKGKEALLLQDIPEPLRMHAYHAWQAYAREVVFGNAFERLKARDGFYTGVALGALLSDKSIVPLASEHKP